MFSAFGNPFHKTSDKPLSEKGLSGVLYYSNKASRDVAQLADDNRVSANNLMTYGALLGDDLTVSNSQKPFFLYESKAKLKFFYITGRDKQIGTNNDSMVQYHDGILRLYRPIP